MNLKLEQLEYQQQAIDSVISVFKGQERNTFDNACYEGIRANMLSLSQKEIEQNIKSKNKNEISSQEIGEMVMEKLRPVDEIAYVRFASVYRKFKDKEEFLEEMKKLLE